MKQTNLFPNDSESIKQHHLAKLRTLKAELRASGKRKQAMINEAREADAQQDWETYKLGVTRYKKTR